MKKNLFNVFLVCVFCVAAISDVFAQQIKVTGKVTDLSLIHILCTAQGNDKFAGISSGYYGNSTFHSSSLLLI